MKYIVTLVAIALVVLLKDVLMLLFFGILMGVVFSFPVGWLSRIMPRGVAVLMTLIGLLVGGVGVTYLGYQPVSEQVGEIRTRAPEALHQVRAWFKRSGAQGMLNPGGVTGATQSPEASASGPGAAAVISHTKDAAVGVTSILTALLVVIVLGAFLSHEPESYRKGLRKLCPREHEADFDELWTRMGSGLRHWLGGILISMTIMGVVTAVALLIAGVKAWPMLGLLTFMATFVPYAGAIGSAIPGLILALAQTPSRLVPAMIAYLCVHIVEGYIVEPLIMKRAVVIRPAVLLAWQIAITALGGILGVIVATPLLVCTKILIEYLYIEKRLGKEGPAANRLISA